MNWLSTMAYSDFTLKDLKQRFNMTISESPDLFQVIQELEPSSLLRSILSEYTPLAIAINTEKARSELLIAPILVEVRTHLKHRVSLFSGVDFTVAPEQGLNGTCDFIISKSPEQQFVSVPVVTIVEAKNENLKAGLGQCTAEMLAAKWFNEREGQEVKIVFGVVTTGTLWRFLQMEGEIITLDQREYHIERIGKILGILVKMAWEG